MLERSVYYGKLRVDSVATLQALSSRLGMEALQRINREARALQQVDEHESNADQRMRFGVYFYHESVNTDLEETSEADRTGEGERDEEEGGSDET
jgi:hypothetical protein